MTNPPKNPPPQPSPQPREVESHELLQGRNQVVIRHDGEAYRLILTRNNRLILQK